MSGFFCWVFISDALGLPLCVSVSVEQGWDRARCWFSNFPASSRILPVKQCPICSSVTWRGNSGWHAMGKYLRHVEFPRTSTDLYCSYVGKRLVGFCHTRLSVPIYIISKYLKSKYYLKENFNCKKFQCYEDLTCELCLKYIYNLEFTGYI